MNNEEHKKIIDKYKKDIKKAIKDLKTPGRRHKQIPNILTASRLISPLLIIPAALAGNITFAIWSAVGFGLTDLADGKLSEILDARSDLGADLDAFTDKIFAGSLLIAGSIINPLLATNIALELGISGINLKQKFSGKPAGSTSIGKKKTWALFALGALGLLAPALNIPTAVVSALAVGTAVLQGMTLASYIKKYQDADCEEETSHVTTTPVIKIEEKPQVINNTKAKVKSEGQPATLEEFKELREFLHEEQKNQQSQQIEKPAVYQKQNTSNN